MEGVIDPFDFGWNAFEPHHSINAPVYGEFARKGPNKHTNTLIYIQLCRSESFEARKNNHKKNRSKFHPTHPMFSTKVASVCAVLQTPYQECFGFRLLFCINHILLWHLYAYIYCEDEQKKQLNITILCSTNIYSIRICVIYDIRKLSYAYS